MKSHVEVIFGSIPGFCRSPLSLFHPNLISSPLLEDGFHPVSSSNKQTSFPFSLAPPPTPPTAKLTPPTPSVSAANAGRPEVANQGCPLKCEPPRVEAVKALPCQDASDAIDWVAGTGEVEGEEGEGGRLALGARRRFGRYRARTLTRVVVLVFAFCACGPLL